jgi:hypothetical protein
VAARAPWYVAAGRWLRSVGAGQRKEPWTGAPQVRRYGHGWDTIGDAVDTPKIEHPKPPRRQSAVARPSSPIGVAETGGIGMGEAIGTRVGTPMHEVSAMRASDSIMPIGVGGAIRGGASRTGKSSGS